MENYNGYPITETKSVNSDSARPILNITALQQIRDEINENRNGIMNAVKGKHLFQYVAGIQQNLVALKSMNELNGLVDLHNRINQLKLVLSQLINRDATRADVSESVSKLLIEIDNLIKGEKAKKLKALFLELANHANEISSMIDGIDSILG